MKFKINKYLEGLIFISDGNDTYNYLICYVDVINEKFEYKAILKNPIDGYVNDVSDSRINSSGFERILKYFDDKHFYLDDKNMAEYLNRQRRDKYKIIKELN